MASWREASVDEPAAHALLTEYFRSRAAGFPPSQGKYRTVFPATEHFTAPNGVFLVVVDDGVDVGCGGIRTIDLADGTRTLELKHLWLQPHTRGRGMGRALLAELERRARDLGAERLVLDTNDSLEAAGGLYRSSGFESIPPYNDNKNATTWYAKTL